jgi:predicted metal-dependent hydrolase
MKHDRIRRDERARLRRALQSDPRLAVFRRRLGSRLRAYLRPGFHPAEVQDQHLIERHLSEFRYAVAAT